MDETCSHAGCHHRRNAIFAHHNRAMPEWSANVGDDCRSHGEKRRPSGGCRHGNQHVTRVHLSKIIRAAPKMLITPPATAAELNSMARNKSPLPRKTVAMKRSSFAPRRSRTTPTNHKKAMPENGTRFSARLTVLQLPES